MFLVRNRKLYISVYLCVFVMCTDVTLQLRDAVLRQAQAQNLTEVCLTTSHKHTPHPSAVCARQAEVYSCKGRIYSSSLCCVRCRSS